MFGVLCDSFTRAVVFPGLMDLEDGQHRTSGPWRVLARPPVQHLEYYGTDLEDLPEPVAPDTSVAPVGDAVAEYVARALHSSRLVQ
jgi:hypothetical protein